MLDSSQLPLKRILFLVIGLFFISSSLALELGISPPILNFKGETGNEICREFKIFSDKEGLSLRLDDKWADKNTVSKDINDYIYDGKKFEIETKYYNKVILDKEYLGEICIKAKNRGIYYGLLKVNSENGNVGLGSWMIINVTEGNVITLEGIQKRVIENHFDFFIYLGIFLLIALFALILIFYLLTK